MKNFLLLNFVFYSGLAFSEQLADRILIDKSDHSMIVYSNGKAIAHYQVAIGRGDTDAKRCEGDKRTPEGSYIITAHKADSRYHYALRLSYPSAEDDKNAKALGCKPGGDIMIHGLMNGFGWIGNAHRLFDWTLGCIAITNSEINQLSKLAPVGTRVDIQQ